jgi:hypothetical protein
MMVKFWFHAVFKLEDELLFLLDIFDNVLLVKWNCDSMLSVNFKHKL